MRALLILALVCPLLRAGEQRDLKQQAADLVQRMASKDPEERLAAVRGAAQVHHRTLLAPLVRLLKDKDRRIRTEAIAALGRRDDPRDRKSAAHALAAWLKTLERKEQTREELLEVVQALHDLAQPLSIRPLLDIKSGSDRSVMRARAMAVANVPAKEAIHRLIQFGYKDRRGKDATRKIAIQALAYATQVRLRGGIEAWREWWSENEATFDLLAAEEKRAAAKAKANKRQQKKNKKKRKKKNE